MFWYFGHEACGILAPQIGIESAPPALEGKVLNIGLQGSPPILNQVFFVCVLSHISCLDSLAITSYWKYHLQIFSPIQ